MYLPHFGLRHYPFEKTLGSDELLDTESQAEARARIAHLVELRGIGLLTGESGVGRTALCRQVTDTLHEGLRQVRYVTFSTGNVRDTCNAIATAFGLAESQSRATLFRGLRTELSRLVAEAGKLPVPVFDEAHHLGNDVLAEFRMLTNYRMDSGNRLCLLPVGLTELRNRLGMAVHEPPARRIIVNCHIPALRHEEVGACIEHRMRLAGADVPVFGPAAIEAAALASNRIPRQVNRIAHHALIAAAADGSRTVTDSHVNRAADEILPWAAAGRAPTRCGQSR